MNIEPSNTHYASITDIISTEKVLFHEPMNRHTSFRIGGEADCFVTPTTVEEIATVISWCKEQSIPYYIMGNGSNLLVSDKGFRGVIVQLYKQFSTINIEGQILTAQAGALLSTIANRALKAHLSGLEFAHGIPGTLGGALMMNAGAYDGEMSHVIQKATVIDDMGSVFDLTHKELDLGYRCSIFSYKPYIVLEATMELQSGVYEEILSKMSLFTEKRTSKQPLEFPSAGSTFKRPPGFYAGQLIQEAGLKGYKIGGAQVSEMHSGFIINCGGATAADVLALIKHVQDSVLKNSGILLEPEVKRIGEF